jgi:hypothetical protein
MVTIVRSFPAASGHCQISPSISLFTVEKDHDECRSQISIASQNPLTYREPSYTGHGGEIKNDVRVYFNEVLL